MSRVGRVLAVTAAVVIGVAVPAGAAIAAKQKKVSTAKYAKVVCGNSTDMAAAINDFIDTYNNKTSDDPATFQSEAVSLTNDLIDELDALETKIKKSYPDIDNGKKIAKLFQEGVSSTRGEIADALADFEAADANGVAFQADVSSFELTFNLLDTTRSDPFRQVTDQDLLKAFDSEKSCKDVVNIIGA